MAIHKNIGDKVVRIHDSHWNAYYLKPGDQVDIDKISPRESVIVIPQEHIVSREEELYKLNKKQQHDLLDKLGHADTHGLRYEKDRVKAIIELEDEL